MLCENCKKNAATTYFKQTVNGHVREVFLCSDCAAKLGLGDPFSSFGDFGMGFGFGMMPGLFSASAAGQDLKCPTCGMTLTEVNRNGKMGCADCYETFRDYLHRLLPRIAGNKTHTGKKPGGSEKAEDDLPTLKKKLEEAIRTENFEEASVLRDKIRELNRANGDEKKGE